MGGRTRRSAAGTGARAALLLGLLTGCGRGDGGDAGGAAARGGAGGRAPDGGDAGSAVAQGGAPGGGPGGEAPGGALGAGGTDASPPPADALYVDPALTADHCATYDPGSRACGAGESPAFRTLAGAAAVASAGDTVVLREGTYEEPLSPTSSGVEGSPLTFRAYPGETPTLTGDAEPAMIQLLGVSHVVLAGIAVRNARWLEAQDAHHVTVRYCTFEASPATGTTGNVRFVRSDDNLLLGNRIHGGNDDLLLIDSERNVVEGNTVTEGGHSVFGIRCGDRNVIRRNRFANTRQKIGEVYDCGEDTTAVPNAFDSTRQNLIEANEFTATDRHYSTSGGNGIQYAGQDGIVRRNVFRNANVGLGMQTYADEALHNRGNRVYANVFFANECAGISLGADEQDNAFVNNVLAENLGWDGDCEGDGPAQLLHRGDLAGVRFWRNDLWAGAPGQAVILEEFAAGATLASLEASAPGTFWDNLEVDPGFVDAAGADFRLRDDSPLRDAGAFLTVTVGDGRGTVLAVQDARFFYDGFGIAGEVGDTIQLEGQADTAVLVAADREENRLTVDRELAWTDGLGVALAYRGSAPDVGAFETP